MSDTSGGQGPLSGPGEPDRAAAGPAADPAAATTGDTPTEIETASETVTESGTQDGAQAVGHESEEASRVEPRTGIRAETQTGTEAEIQTGTEEAASIAGAATGVTTSTSLSPASAAPASAPASAPAPGASGGSPTTPADPADSAEAPKPRRRHRVRNTVLALLAVFALAAGGLVVAAAYDVHKLTANLKHAPLVPPGFSQPPEAVDAFGQSAMNILLIGSDTRSTSADSQLGGDAGPGANADSEMVVHLSADRTNATVLSIPRDTITQLPQCAGGGDGMINSALQYGPACQVAAVHELTGLTIDHFIMFDFSGVVSISQDVGGIPVCVTASVRDPNSGLTLYQGTTNVQGIQALEFLRTRDAFYDGSDIGRERATHYFFSQLIQQMKASASFTNLGELQSLAEDVTKSTTVDNGLDSITALIGLGQDLNKVPTNRITFLIMPWGQDPNNSNRVDPSYPAANNVFAAIGADYSFSTASGAPAPVPTATSDVGGASQDTSQSGTPTPTASPSATVPTTAPTTTPPTDQAAIQASETADAIAHPMHVDVINASGTTGRATTLVQELFTDGFVYVSGNDATSTYASTTLQYEPSEATTAKLIAADLGLPSTALVPTATTSLITLTIGTDWQLGTTYPVAVPTTPTPTSTSTSSGNGNQTPNSLPTDSYLQNAATSGGCITANPDFVFQSNN